VIPFSNRGLVNVQGVNPKVPFNLIVAALCQKVTKILPYCERLRVEKDSLGNCFVTPDIGESFVRWLVLERYSVELARDGSTSICLILVLQLDKSDI
jgi:hypothetical protein